MQPAQNTSQNSWIMVPRRLLQPRSRLICLPHAGAGASLYFSWAERLQSAGIELRSVQYPGRENRLREPLIDNTEGMVHALADAWLPISGGKHTVLFGHSMGALLAHELALEIVRRGLPNPPRRVIISGRNPPNIPSGSAAIYHLPDSDFTQAVAIRHNNLPQEIFSDPESAALFTRVLRADFTILDTYSWKPSPPLDMAISILGGTEDNTVRSTDLEGWRSFTRRTCRIHMVKGDHFFHQSSPNDVIAAILRDI